MLRRLALLAGLLAPLAAWGQVTVDPSAVGKTNCASPTATTLTVSWETGTSNIPSSTFFQASATTVANSSCSSSIATANFFITDQSNSSNTSSGSNASTVTLQDLLDASGGSCAGGDIKIYICVQLISSSNSLLGSATGNLVVNLSPPAIPTLNSVTSGDSALYGHWSAGTGSSVAVTSYKMYAAVLAVGPGTTDLQQVHSDSPSGTATDFRLGGLVNGVTYRVTVTSISAGGNESLPSNFIDGTPYLVNDFWDQYQAATDGKAEPGGCAGGAAGLLSLVGLLGFGRALRRRS